MRTEAAGKQALQGELIARTGPHVIVEQLEGLDPQLTQEPAEFLRALALGALAAWSSGTARTAMTLFTRQLLDDIESAQSVFDAIRPVIDAVSKYLSEWQRAGLVRPAASAEALVWELFAPLIYIRFAYLQATAPQTHVAAGLNAARVHVEGFIAANIVDATPPSNFGA